MNGHKACERAKRAHARRWGASALSIAATVCGALVARLPGGRYPSGRQFVRTVDHENGSVCDWSFHASRLRRISERPPTK